MEGFCNIEWSLNKFLIS
uniref:Uncharacterized protein n=1 Tax=Rhizophora mucronata TaxID=61149 RepID=A0A2P2QI37_RHIMU